jgi:hypothetical protein
MKQQKIQWRKIPSVTTGGKPYFYRGNAIGSSIVWNRGLQAYVCTLWGKEIGQFETVAMAKLMVQKTFDNTLGMKPN